MLGESEIRLSCSARASEIFARRVGVYEKDHAHVTRNPISQVIAVEEALKGGEHAACAEAIRRVQEGEQKKLQMTCTIQVLRKSAAANRWSWQQPDGGQQQQDSAPNPSNGQAGLNPSWANGNFDCTVHPAVQCGCGPDSSEPTVRSHAPRHIAHCNNVKGWCLFGHIHA